MTMADSTAVDWDHEAATAHQWAQDSARAGDLEHAIRAASFVGDEIARRTRLVRAHTLADFVYDQMGCELETLREATNAQWRKWAQKAGVKKLTDDDIRAVLDVVKIAKTTYSDHGDDPCAGLDQF